MNVNSLIHTGFMEVPIPGITDGIENLISGFTHLIESTKQNREVWKFWLPESQSDEPDSGLIEKRIEDGKDPKFIFHYRPFLIEQLNEAGVDCTPHLPFLQQAHKMYSKLEELTAKTLIRLDHILPGNDFLENLYRLHPEYRRHVLRLLYYKPGYGTMAKTHDDKSFLTHHVADSRSGLHFLEDRKLYTVKKDTVLTFTGLKAQLHTMGRLKSMPHYVLNEKLSEPRWAVVFFSHIKVDFTENEVRELIVRNIEQYKKDLALTT